jgi:hypothetical protein
LTAHLEGQPCRLALVDLKREGHEAGRMPAPFKIQTALKRL